MSLFLAAFVPMAEANPGHGVSLTLSSPMDYQVFQRSSAEAGAILVAGSWGEPGTASEAVRAEVRLGGSGAWTPLPASPKAAGFRAVIPAPAADHWMPVEVRLVEGAQVQTVVEVRHVGVGEVFIVAGQSNSANHAEVRLKPQSGLVSAFDGSHWQVADDPQPGASGEKGSFIPPLGDALVAAFHVPVGFTDVGVGSTSVREWLPASETFAKPPTKPDNTVAVEGGRFASTGVLLSRLVSRIRTVGPSGARAVLWHQGESDWNQGPGHEVTAAEYQAMLQVVIAASRRDGGWEIPWVVAQASYHHPADTGSEAFRSAQRAVADNHLTFVGPNTDALPSSLREKNGTGVHFSEAGQKAHAQLWAQVLVPWIRSRLGSP